MRVDPPEARLPPTREPPLVPAWVAVVALFPVLLTTQLGGGIARSIALALVRQPDGAPPAPDHAAGILAGMAAGAGLLAAIALAVPLLGDRSPRVCYQLLPAPPQVVTAAAVGTFALGPLADTLMVTMQSWFPNLTLGTLPRLHALATGQPFWLLWPFFALLPGIAEELFFRGFVQTAFVRTRVAVLASAASFALFHLDPHHIVGVFPLGLFLAWTAARFGTLVTIVAHTLNNTLALLTIQVSELDVGYGSDTPMPRWWLLVGLMLWAVATAVLVRESRQSAPVPS